MNQPALSLPHSDDPRAIQDFLEQAKSIEKIWCNESSHLDGRAFLGRSFPNIASFDFFGCKSLADADAFFSALPELQILSFWTCKAPGFHDAEVMAALARSHCWPRLRSLTLQAAYRGNPFESFEGWKSHWTGREMSVNDLRLNGLTLEALESIWQAAFPRLTRLTVGPALSDVLLSQLLEQANMPNLELLDLRFNGITGEALQRFGARARERFPKLREIGIEFYTGEKIEDCDWNGAVVQSFDVQLSPEEITKQFLTGTGIQAMKYP